VSRPLSAIAPDWWDYTTLDRELIDEAARLTPSDLMHLSRPGFNVILYDTLEDFYLAEALEYINAWRTSSDDSPIGICSPIGPTEQLPLVARIVNALDLDVRSGEEVVLIGEQEGAAGIERITATDWADQLGTIGYEIVCGISARVPRVVRP